MIYVSLPHQFIKAALHTVGLQEQSCRAEEDPETKQFSNAPSSQEVNLRIY